MVALLPISYNSFSDPTCVVWFWCVFSSRNNQILLCLSFPHTVYFVFFLWFFAWSVSSMLTSNFFLLLLYLTDWINSTVKGYSPYLLFGLRLWEITAIISRFTNYCAGIFCATNFWKSRFLEYMCSIYLLWHKGNLNFLSDIYDVFEIRDPYNTYILTDITFSYNK